jgi:hypothetical protein
MKTYRTKARQLKKRIAKMTGTPETQFEIREINKVAFGGEFEVWYLVAGERELRSIKL